MKMVFTRLRSYAQAFLGLFVIFLIGAEGVYADSSLSFSPSSGTVSDVFYVDLLLNSDSGDEVAGFDFTVNYTGQIIYVSTSVGTLNCSPTVTESAAGIDVLCLGQLEYLNLSGSFARLYFEPISDGTALFSFTVNDTDAVVGSLGTSVMVLDVSTGSNVVGGVGGGGDLPNTGVLDDYMMPIGLLFVVVGIVVFKSGRLVDLIFLQVEEDRGSFRSRL